MSGEGTPALGRAIALGLLQGPTELLPVSSSAHTTLMPWLSGRQSDTLDPTVRKAFEVALHLGTAAALLARPPWPPGTRRPALAFLLPAAAVPSLAGYVLGPLIARRLGTPATIAAGLLAGSIAIASGELSARAHAGAERSAQEAGLGDGVIVGVAQALSLIPGVSRSGASLAAARARGFSAKDADRLSWYAGMPVLTGAALLQGYRLTRSGGASRSAGALVGGACSAFASTLLGSYALTCERRSRMVLACAGYRSALAIHVIRRLRANGTPNPFPTIKRTSPT